LGSSSITRKVCVTAFRRGSGQKAAVEKKLYQSGTKNDKFMKKIEFLVGQQHMLLMSLRMAHEI